MSTKLAFSVILVTFRVWYSVPKIALSFPVSAKL